jgi:hypothetical protein
MTMPIADHYLIEFLLSQCKDSELKKVIKRLHPNWGL